MTNKEKAQEIADLYFLNEDVMLQMTGEECNISCKNAVLDMAEWKDKQFKEYLEKEKATLRYRSDMIGHSSEECAALIDEIIDENFWNLV